MKVRDDFVTNSSSSSFVVAMKAPPELDQETLTKYPFLKQYLDMVKRMFGSGNWINTKDDLDRYFIDRFAWTGITLEDLLNDPAEGEWHTKKYNEFLEKIESGFVIWEDQVEYGEESKMDMLHSLSDGENFFVLESD